MFVGPMGVNKASGLERLGDRINIKLEEMVAFGDGSNDFEMLKEVEKKRKEFRNIEILIKLMILEEYQALGLK